MKFEQRDLGTASENSSGERQRFATIQLIIGTVITAITIYIFAFALTLFGTRFIPDSWEASLGKKADFSKQLGADDPKDKELLALKKKAKQTFDKVYKTWQSISDLPQRKLKIKFDVIEMDDGALLHERKQIKNAFALPGGAIFLTKALIKEVTEETALALVIAHEIAHVERRHVLQNIGLSMTNSILLSVIFGGRNFDATSWVDKIGSSSFSRSREREADTDGMRVVHKAFGHTKNALQFFELIDKEEHEHFSLSSSFLRSHPVTRDRIDYLREMQKELKER